MWLRGQEVEMLCVVGMDEASAVLLTRAGQLAQAMDARLTLAVCGELGGARALARFGSWAHEISGLPPSTCTVLGLTGPESTRHERLCELVDTLRPHIVLAPGSADAARSFSWLAPNLAWSIASQAGASLLFTRPRVAPATVLALADFAAASQEVVELSAELGRCLSATVDYVSSTTKPDPQGLDAMALVEKLVGRTCDIAVVGLAPGRSRTPATLLRDTRCSLLLVPQAPPLLH